MMRPALLTVLITASCLLSGCGALVPSFYGLGEEGRIREQRFEGKWYMAQQSYRYDIKYQGNDVLEITLLGDEDDDDVNFHVNIVAHEGQILFDAITDDETDGILHMPMHIIGRVVWYDECWCLEALGGGIAYATLQDAGLVLLDRGGQMENLRAALEAPALTDEERRAMSAEEQLRNMFQPSLKEAVENVLLASPPSDLRAFLSRDEFFPEIYKPIIFCPGEPLEDEDAWEEMYPAAAARLEEADK